MKKKLLLFAILSLLLTSCDKNRDIICDYIKSHNKCPSSFKLISLDMVRHEKADTVQSSGLYHVCNIAGRPTKSQFFSDYIYYQQKDIDYMDIDSVKITTAYVPPVDVYAVSYDISNIYGAMIRYTDTIGISGDSVITPRQLDDYVNANLSETVSPFSIRIKGSELKEYRSYTIGSYISNDDLCNKTL